MDKLAVNRQVVLMRKEAKIAQRGAIQKLTKQIKTWENRLEKIKKIANAEKEKRVQSTIIRKKNLLCGVKSVCLDTVSKKALQTSDPWSSVLKNQKASETDRVIAVIANHPRIERCVKAFREENPNWELYLNTLLELWDEKKKIKQGDTSSKTQLLFDNRMDDSENQSTLKTQKPKLVKSNELRKKQSKHVVNRIGESEKSEQEEVKKNNTKDVEDNDFGKVMKPVVDDFFINKKSQFASLTVATPPESNYKQKPSKIQSFSCDSTKRTKLVNNYHEKFSSEKELRETLHPSWEAKKKQKETLKIDLNNTQAKRIRFTD